MKQHHHHHEHNHLENEINIAVDYKGNFLYLHLTDKEGNAPQLAVSHEKILHLMIVSADLEQYYHLHPIDKGNGHFQQEISLEDGLYKIIVDVNPINLGYQVTPIDLHVGYNHAHAHAENQLEVDEVLSKTIDNITVELTIDSLVANQPTTLTYQIKGGEPEPYLGALGHVVIFDDNITKFIHVHPSFDDQTIFETQFNEPGIYKIWSEFKFGKKVNTYSFVIRVDD